MQPKKEDKLDRKPFIDQIALPTGTRGIKTKRLKGMVQLARLNLTVKAYNSKALELLRWKLAMRGTKEFRHTYPICVTDKDFAERERERKAPGYIDLASICWTGQSLGSRQRRVSRRNPRKPRILRSPGSVPVATRLR